MKKRILLLLLLLLAFCLSSVYSGWSFGNGFSFEIAPMDPLFQENRAYPFSNTTSFSMLFSPEDSEYLPTDFLVSKGDGGSYALLPFDDVDTSHNSYWNLKAATNLGLLRFSYRNYISVEMYIHGGLNSVFANYGGTNVLGFDGMYGLGATAQIMGQLTIRFGFHHFSGHWGDEMLAKFNERNDRSSYHTLTEYTRNNSLLLDIAYQPVKYFRVMAEFELPQQTSWIRPYAHIPDGVNTPSYNHPLVGHIGEQEGFYAPRADYPDFYKAWRIGLGAELMYPVEGVGEAYLSYDVQFHQDGKIDYIGKIAYNPDKPWDIEHTVALGFQFEETPDSPSFAIQLTYHDGRFPLLNFFYQKSRYFGVGLVASF